MKYSLRPRVKGKVKGKAKGKAKRKAKQRCRHQFQGHEETGPQRCTLCEFTQCRHQFFPHPTELKRISCSHCGCNAAPGKGESSDNKLLRYLSSRRKRRHVENLNSLTLPLAATSCHVLNISMAESLVTSNTGFLHITLLEGAVTASDSYEQQVRRTLNSEPTCSVVAIHHLPTVDPTRRLVVANVALPAWTRLSSITATPCKFPQWPLHITLGTVQLSNLPLLDTLRRDLLGRTLYTSPDLLTWLAPVSLQRPTAASSMMTANEDRGPIS